MGSATSSWLCGWIYPRAYNKGDVLVDGVRCPIVGRICMDQFMIRLPHEFPIGTTVTPLEKMETKKLPRLN